MKAMADTGYCIFETSIGPCAIAWTAGTVASCQLPEHDRAGTLRRMRERHPEWKEAGPPYWVGEVIARVQRLLEGEHDDLSDIPLAMHAEPEFNRRVYAVTRAIAPGSTLTYGEVAQKIGEPASARAVGQALGHNPFAPIVPCHRVLGAGNSGTGFSATGGVATKLRMLEIERAQIGGQAGLFD